MQYGEFVKRKLSVVPPTGIAASIDLRGGLFPHQDALTQWAIKRGRSAIFADTGLGKMRMELAWADAVHRHTGGDIMIHTPLAVAQQIASEAQKMGISATVCREESDLRKGINITNYDRLHKFDTARFVGVVLDESGCIKHHDTKTFKALTDAYRNTQFKLPASATPAPNDWTELGTHAEFLGICTRQEMLAEFFTHDGGDTSVWRLKGHARDVFWRWVASWGAMIRRPSDLGFDDGAYNLPNLRVHEHTVNYEMPLNGMLFSTEAQSLSERREARRASMEDRVKECVTTVFGEWRSDGLETGARGSQEGKGAGKPRASSEAPAIGEGQPGTKQGSTQGVHEGVLRSEPGEVQESDAGTESAKERGQAGTVRTGRGMACGAQGVSEGLASIEPGEAPCAATQEVQHHTGASRGNDEGSGRRLRNLRDGSGGCQELPDGGSLSHIGEGSRSAVLQLQSGSGEVQGQPGTSTRGDQVSLDPWVIWCDLNAEQDMLERAFGDLAFSIRGSDSIEEKEDRLMRWLAGERPVIISKPSMLGYGLNMQHAARMAFVGVTDSYEAYYQAVRRCWRFGQKRDVHVHVFASKAEGAVVANLTRKEREAGKMAESLSAETRDAVLAEVRGLTRQTNEYNANRAVSVPAFLRAA